MGLCQGAPERTRTTAQPAAAPHAPTPNQRTAALAPSTLRPVRPGALNNLARRASCGVAPPQAIRNIKSRGPLACGALNRSYIMKRICATAALFLLSSTFALAQTTPTTGGMTPNTGGVANPSTPSTSAPAPSNSSTVGQPPTANPSNSQDLSNRSNPQDLTKSGASNPQDLSRPAK
jgi:hypothetical protein